MCQFIYPVTSLCWFVIAPELARAASLFGLWPVRGMSEDVINTNARVVYVLKLLGDSEKYSRMAEFNSVIVLELQTGIFVHFYFLFLSFIQRFMAWAGFFCHVGGV